MAVLSPLSMDGFLPAVDSAAKGLNTDVGQIMVAFGMLTIGNGIGQIIYGPLSDRFGRRPIIIAGLLIYILSSGLSALANDVEMLFLFRFIQGLAVASTMIILRAVVRDLFGVTEGAKLFANLFMVLALIPLIAPILAGHLTVWFGWRAVFVMMAVVSLIVLAIILYFLEESLQEKDVRAMTPKVLAVSFAEIITDRCFVTFLLIGTGAYAGLFAVLGGIAPVMTGTLGQTSDVFGYQFSAVMIGHFVAAALAGKLVGMLGIKKILFIATSISLTGGLLIYFLAWAGITTIYAILIPVALHLVGFAMTIPAMTAGALSNFHHMAGRASSLLGFLQQSAGAAVAITLGLTADGTQFPMVTALAASSLFAFLAFAFMIPRVTLKAH
ncbi:MAG: multidrug effflux MFS transporter [Rhodospirillaceae bacterium]|nr:multidrug effflux MFS transporter [Rhodospirillaceae bacterium]MBT4589616.1 multidrug effflux MFS transporter [Rhodospirillaceae bacterium]MBT4938664.1 multidrug effflux MFS transporter [Rhodospirillaceae bacterium]MBT5939960.1 multidrug effflux MFS transporter [Rhodospirillaceae bacterium]MBT7268627.1 multidrug effflux MFS transporter [Rhodospirillaceae bacterium]